MSLLPNGADLMEEMHKVKRLVKREYTICHSGRWIESYWRNGIRCVRKNYGAII